MSRGLGAALLVLAATLLAAAPSGADMAGPAAPETLTLRLPDVGSNYELGSSRCGRRSADEERWWPSTLPSLSRRFPHQGCVIAFGESWTAPGSAFSPNYVMSAAFSFRDSAGPMAALQRARAVAAHILDADRPPLPARPMLARMLEADRRGDLRPLSIDAALGDELRAFRLDGCPKPGTVLLWRSGSVLALVLAAGPASDRTTQAAIRLASAQQARIATPTPLLPSTSTTSRSRSTTHASGCRSPGWAGSCRAAAAAPLAARRRRGPAVALRCALGSLLRIPRSQDLCHVSLYMPRPVRRQVQRLVRYLQQHVCVRRFDASADGVHETVIAYHMPPRRQREPRRFNGLQAFAFLPGVAATIEAASCYRCRRRSPYASVAGLRALVRALASAGPERRRRPSD